MARGFCHGCVPAGSVSEVACAYCGPLLAGPLAGVDPIADPAVAGWLGAEGRQLERGDVKFLAFLLLVERGVDLLVRHVLDVESLKDLGGAEVGLDAGAEHPDRRYGGHAAVTGERHRSAPRSSFAPRSACSSTMRAAASRVIPWSNSSRIRVASSSWRRE
jgi:hypothetical protein